jgi:hypothetical protein
MRPDKKRKEKDEATVQHSGTAEQAHSGKLRSALLGFCDAMAGSHARDK